MTAAEYKKLTEITPRVRLITAHDLTDKSGRTLLYGYTIEKLSWHVYLNYEEIIKTVIYEGHGGEVKQLNPECNEQYIPSKRLYPSKCDFEFCNLLKEAGVHLPFTTFDKMHMPDTCHGRLLRGDFI